MSQSNPIPNSEASLFSNDYTEDQIRFFKNQLKYLPLVNVQVSYWGLHMIIAALKDYIPEACEGSLHKRIVSELEQKMVDCSAKIKDGYNIV